MLGAGPVRRLDVVGDALPALPGHHGSGHRLVADPAK